MIRSITTGILLLTASAAGGQGIPFSQHGTVTQRVGLTTVHIEYNRPVARGRALFGGLVPWGRIWHPGADSATTLTVSRDVTVQGETLPAGRYSLWTIPGERAWTIVFSRRADVYHTPYPGEAFDVLRVVAQPEAAGHMETMAFYFPVVHRDSAVLALHWGTVRVPLLLTVDNGDQ